MHNMPHSDTVKPTRAREVYSPRVNKPARGWAHHKQWIRETVLHGTPYATAAAACGYSRVTAWAVLQRKPVKRYVSSLRRWQCDQALQARIESSTCSESGPGADDLLL